MVLGMNTLAYDGQLTVKNEKCFISLSLVEIVFEMAKCSRTRNQSYEEIVA